MDCGRWTCYAAVISSSCRLQIRYGYHWGPFHGREHGTSFEHYLPAGEYLTTIGVRSGWILNTLRFVASHGIDYADRPGGGPHVNTHYVTSGEEVAYFSG